MKEAESEVIFPIEEAPEGGFVARALGHSISPRRTTSMRSATRYVMDPLSLR
jgi:hypothetical protein